MTAHSSLTFIPFRRLMRKECCCDLFKLKISVSEWWIKKKYFQLPFNRTIQSENFPVPHFPQFFLFHLIWWIDEEKQQFFKFPVVVYLWHWLDRFHCFHFRVQLNTSRSERISSSTSFRELTHGGWNNKQAAHDGFNNENKHQISDCA